jgi:hexosaminidase
MKKIILILVIAIFHQYLFSQDTLQEKYNLMPWPQQINENNTPFKIDEKLTISIAGKDFKKRVANASVQFLRRLANRTGVFINTGFPIKQEKASIKISFDTVSNLTIESDETYSLEVKENSVLIKAKTDVGALRGLETLLQLVNFNQNGYYFEGVAIKDSPRFVWRGLMIDAARHFQPMSVLKRNLNAMASVKLNVFHWHLTDDQGFRVESKVYPKLHEKASDGLFYTQEQVKEIVKYASNLGIRVIPEFDVPGHSTAILTAYPELGSKEGANYAIERFSGIFDPTLNPSIEATYTFLENLFTEITPLFPDEYFHIGGDENEGKHWDGNEKIQEFKKQS